MSITLYHGDSRKILREMAERGELVDSVVTDAPYGLKSVVKRFGKKGSAPAQHGRDGAFRRQSRGFMGQRWDGTEIERDPTFWRLVYDVMKPGAYIVAFSSSRTYHHMATAIERAGFVTHPMIGWVFGSGMPKAHNAARAVDQALGRRGKTRAIGNPVRRIRPGADQNKDGTWEKLTDRLYQPGEYEPATAEGARWRGYAYGGQARKPALEPIYVGQKPFSERNGALNLLKHGVGAVNIDGCRVASEDGKAGRYPANLILDGSEDVMALFPWAGGAAGRLQSDRRDGGGSAARFFESYPFLCWECCDQGWITELGSSWDVPPIACPSCAGMCLDPLPFDGNPIEYSAKANKRDRAGSAHPTVKPIGLIASLVRHVTPPGGLLLDPFAGSGTTGQAALNEGRRAVLIEMEYEYATDIRRRFGLSSSLFRHFADLLGDDNLAPVNSTSSGVPTNFPDLLG